MVAFTRYTDALRVSFSGNGPAGKNTFDCRSAWHGLTAITFDSGGVLPPTQWYQDTGPLGMSENEKEPRAFCTRGGCHFTFTGRTLVIRLNVAWSWFTGALLLIDGRRPSTMGLLTGLDTLSCDAQTYGLLSDAYIDVVAADGLPDATHTASITIASPKTDQFFSIAGYREGTLGMLPVTYFPPAWQIEGDGEVPSNKLYLQLENNGAGAVKDIVVYWPPVETMTPGGGGIPPNFTVASLASSAKAEAPEVEFRVAEEEHSGPRSLTIGVQAHYPDPDGSIMLGTTYFIDANSELVTYTPVLWYQDTATPDGSHRAHCDSRNSGGQPWVATFTFEGTSFELTVQRSAGWGMLGVYDGPAEGAALLYMADCSVDEAGAFHTYHVAGFAAGTHTVSLRKVLEDGLPVVFVRASYSTVAPYTFVAETLRLDYRVEQPIPLRTVGASLLPPGYDFMWPPQDINAVDVGGDVVRSNHDLAYTETLARTPTFAVFYGGGHRELLSEYDILIVDPLGVKTADVTYWQGLGILVFGYVSSGEEVGFYQNPFDFASPLAPRSGSGPGGYSANYMFTRNPTSGPPDKNSVWASYYMDPRPESGWKTRIVDYYLPQCFEGSEFIADESVVTASATIAAGTRVVFQTARAPIDADADITLSTADLSHVYTRFTDYTYDVKTGCFVLSPTISPAVVAGDTLRISYTRKGHSFDGLFWDTVDTPDVYSSDAFGYQYVEGYADAFAQMLNDVHALYPDRYVIFNRGFTILPQIIAGAKGVMFETWLTAPDNIADLSNTAYHRITDPEAVAYNDAQNALLRDLRSRHVFDVYSLNYCLPGTAGDELRAYCRTKDAEHGYLSWQTIINLTNPEHNDVIELPAPRLQAAAFIPQKRRAYTPPASWDDGATTWDDGDTTWY